MDFRHILAQLKGRGVYRVAALYAAGSWALLQIVDVVFPIVGLEQWAITAVLVAAAAGFPLAVILAWFFELKPGGALEVEPEHVDYGRMQLSFSRVLELGLLLALIGLVGYLYLDRLNPVGTQTPGSVSEISGRPSIAVMPFVDMTAENNMAYFGDGLAEEILNLLAKLAELDVAARTSSFYFKGKDVDIQQIGNHLGVAHVLEGSIRRSGDKLRVTAQLIKVSDGYHLWSETFDRDFADIFTIQDEVARQVTRNLHVLLSDSSQNVLDNRPVLVPQAYEYYLRGRDHLRGSIGRNELDSAVAFFKQAVALDGTYAEAYAGLCDAHLDIYRSDLNPEEFTHAEEACQQALRLDNSAMSVYVALGNLYRYSGEYQPAIEKFEQALDISSLSVDALIGIAQTLALDNQPTRAEEYFHKAIDLRPSDTRAYLGMGNFYFGAGRFREAIPYYQRITELTPDSAQAFNNLGASYAITNQFALAAQAFKRSLEIEPSAYTYSNAGSSLYFSGQLDEAIEMYNQAVELAPEDFEYWGNLGDAYSASDSHKSKAHDMYAKALELAALRLEVNSSDVPTLSLTANYHARTGNKEKALFHLDQARALAPNDMYVYYFSATAYCALGEYDLALKALEVAIELGYSEQLVKLDPGLVPLQSMPQFVALTQAGDD